MARRNKGPPPHSHRLKTERRPAMAAEKRPPFLQTQNGTGQTRCRQRGYAPLSVRRLIDFFKIIGTAARPGGSTAIQTKEISPCSVRRLDGILFLNYRGRCPPRCVDHDTVKGDISFVCKASVWNHFKIIGTAVRPVG